MGAPNRILIIRPSALGDVARSVPVLVSLRDAYPTAQIDWLVQDTFAEVIAAHPGLSNALPFPRRDFSVWARTGRWLRLTAYLRSIGEARYDVVIDAQGLARSGLIAWASGAAERVGHADAREGAWLAYTRRVPADIEQHSVTRMLSLVSALGVLARHDAQAMQLYTPGGARGFAASQPELAGKPYVVLAPTSRWVSKQWPDARFAALARALAGRGLRVAVVGGGSERGQIPQCLKECGGGVVDLVGGTTIAQLMDLIEHAALVVGNDSAAVHLAAGFGRPLLGLYGPTRLHRVGPFGRPGDTIQHVTTRDRLDHKDARGRALMERIGVAEVIGACVRRLG